MEVKQICLRTAPEPYGDGLYRLNKFLLTGWKVVRCNDYLVDISGKHQIYGNEYILEKQFDDKEELERINKAIKEFCNG